MDQRVGLLMERLDVLGDLLAVLKDQVRTSHGEALEWIGEFGFFHLLDGIRISIVLIPEITVIILIAAEILVAAVNIVVDLYADVD